MGGAPLPPLDFAPQGSKNGHFFPFFRPPQEAGKWDKMGTFGARGSNPSGGRGLTAHYPILLRASLDTINLGSPGDGLTPMEHPRSDRTKDVTLV